MKKLLYFFFTLLSFAAFGQVGSQSVSGIKYRVNDSTTYRAAAATAHSQGYADIYWNNQSTTPHFDVWNGSAYEHVFVFGGSGSGGTVTSVSGTTNRVTSTGGVTPVIDISASYVGQSSITTTGTLTSGATGSGFTVALGTSTITGALPVANLTAKYIVDQNTSSTAGATITLDCNSQIQRLFVGSATFSTDKAIALSNTTNTLVFNFIFEITDIGADLTPPSDWLMSTPDFNGTVWDSPAIGKYELGGSFDDVNNVWYVKIAGPFN